MNFFTSKQRENPPSVYSALQRLLIGAIALLILVTATALRAEAVGEVSFDYPQEQQIVAPIQPTIAAKPELPHIDSIVDWALNRSRGQPNIHEDLLRKYVILAYEEAAKWGIDPLLSLAVIAVESRFNYKAASPSGARGLMQVIPFWHKDKITAAEVFNPAANIRAGHMVLQKCLDQQRGHIGRALLCYNGSLGVPGANYDKKVMNTRHTLLRAINDGLSPVSPTGTLN